MSHPPPSNPDPITDLARQVAILTSQLDDLRKRMDQPSSTSHPIFNYSPQLKLDVPHFSGSDTHGWIFKISQFFTYHQTPKEERTSIASSYLVGPALAWYQWMYQNGQLVSWSQFLEKLEIRFPPKSPSQPLSYFPSFPQPPCLPPEEPPPEKPPPSPPTPSQPPPFQNRTPQAEPLLEHENQKFEIQRDEAHFWDFEFEEKEKRENNFGSVSGEEIKLPNDAKAWKDKVISQPSIESTKQSQLFLINPQSSICANPLPQMSLQHVATSLKKLEPLEPCALTAFWAPPICAPHDGWLASGPQAFVFNGYTSPSTQIVNSLGGMHLTQLLKNQQIIGVPVQIRIDNYDFIWAPRSIIGAGEDTIGPIEELDFGFSYLIKQISGVFYQSPNLEDKVDFEGVGNDMILGLLRRLDRSIIKIGIG